MRTFMQTFLAGVAGAATVVVLFGATNARVNQLAPAPPVVTLSGTGITFPDGTVQTTAAPADPRRGFYLTDAETFDGAGARGACAAGYHMAQLWEILDPSNLRYASEAPGARNSGDDGPLASEFLGWVRTGWGTSQSSIPGVGNCSFYDQNASGSGTNVKLSGDWSTEASAAGNPNGWLGPWEAEARSCAASTRVWCVQD